MTDYLLGSYMGTTEGPPLHSSSALGRLAESHPNLQARHLQSDLLQVNHPEFREQDHDEETDIEKEETEAIGLADLETLKWNGDQGEDQAEAQGTG